MKSYKLHISENYHFGDFSTNRIARFLNIARCFEPLNRFYILSCIKIEYHKMLQSNFGKTQQNKPKIASKWTFSKIFRKPFVIFFILIRQKLMIQSHEKNDIDFLPTKICTYKVTRPCTNTNFHQSSIVSCFYNIWINKSCIRQYGFYQNRQSPRKA